VRIFIKKNYADMRRRTVEVKAWPKRWVKGDGWFLTPQGKKIASFVEDGDTITITF
jgi:hypothetical protein